MKSCFAMECGECSSSVASELSKAAEAASRRRSWIETTILKVTTSPNLSITILDPAPVHVIAVERYLAQTKAGSSSSPTATPGPSPTYCYDLTISDGVYQDKWHLAGSLNVLVQRNTLRSGMKVDITKCSYIYEEKRIGWGYMCIEGLECGRDVPNIKTVPFRHREHAESLAVPLRGGRKHYLPLWNNDDPFGDIWLQSQLPAEQLTVNDSTVISLSDLYTRWQDRRRSFPPVIVRILHKSRLRYFGKPDVKHDAPYQAYLEVADQSGMMSVVLWNSLCQKWYKSLKVGTVVLLENYGVKSSYASRTLPTARDPQLKRFDRIELGLNSRNPQADITIIPANQIKPEWKLPDVKYHFITRAELNSLPHDHSCDVIGLLTFVGRAERLRQKDDGEGFWLYRWVHIYDGTSEQPCVLELFATSQPEVFDRIHPMSYLVATQMRVVQSTSFPPYLTTSNESQIFITGLHQGQPYTRDKTVLRFIQWMTTQDEDELMETGTVGGYYHFPPVPETFREYCKDSKAETILREFDELKKEIGELHYRERRRIAVQGIIAAIRYVKDDKETKRVFESEQIQDAECSSITSELEESVGSPSLLSTESAQIEPRSIQANSALRSLQSSPHHSHTNKRRKTQHDPKAQHSTPDEDWFVEESFDPEADSFQPVQPDEPRKTGEPIQREADGLGGKEIDEDLWESELWSQVKNHLSEHLRYSPVQTETVPRQFDYDHREFLMKQYNLHPAKYISEDYQSNKTIDEFGASTGLGQYIVTILDLNHRAAIDVVYLPVLDSEANRTIYGRQAQNGTQLPSGSVNIIQNQCSEGRFKRFPLPGKNVKSVHDLNRFHLVCILDICRLGGELAEVCLNKLYSTAEEKAPNP